MLVMNDRRDAIRPSQREYAGGILVEEPFPRHEFDKKNAALPAWRDPRLASMVRGMRPRTYPSQTPFLAAKISNRSSMPEPSVGHGDNVASIEHGLRK